MCGSSCLRNEKVKYTTGRGADPSILRNWNLRSHVLSLPGAKVPWVELSSPGTFTPKSENNVELSFPEWNMACNLQGVNKLKKRYLQSCIK